MRFPDVLLGIALVLGSAALLSAQISADIVLVDGKVHTENPHQPEAEAVAILGNRIVRVGSSAEVRRLAGPATKIVDLKNSWFSSSIAIAYARCVTRSLRMGATSPVASCEKVTITSPMSFSTE